MRIGLYQYQLWRQSRAWILLGVFVLLGCLTIGLLSGYIAKTMQTLNSLNVHESFGSDELLIHKVNWEIYKKFIIFGFVVSMGLFGLAVYYYRSVEKFIPARRIFEDEEPELHKIAELVSIQLGMAKPRLMMVDAPGLNVISWGLSPNSATVIFTPEVLTTLSPEELRAAITHALLGLRNGDVQFVIVAQAIFFAFIGEFIKQVKAEGITNVAIMNLIPLVFSWIYFPLEINIIISLLVIIPWNMLWMRQWVRSQRDHGRDAQTIDITHDPAALMYALMAMQKNPWIPPGDDFIAPLCMVGKTDGIHATHPPLEERFRDIMLHARVSPEEVIKKANQRRNKIKKGRSMIYKNNSGINITYEGQAKMAGFHANYKLAMFILMCFFIALVYINK